MEPIISCTLYAFVRMSFKEISELSSPAIIKLRRKHTYDWYYYDPQYNSIRDDHICMKFFDIDPEDLFFIEQHNSDEIYRTILCTFGEYYDNDWRNFKDVRVHVFSRKDNI